VATSWGLVENTYENVPKKVILWYIYQSFVCKNSGGDFANVTRVFVQFNHSVQVSNVEDWSVDDPVVHVSSQMVDSWGCFDFLT